MNSNPFIRKFTDPENIDIDSILTRKEAIFTFVNPFSYIRLRPYINMIDRFDGIFVDGISMCLWIRLFLGKKISRISFDMTSLARHLFERCNRTGETIYLIGSKKEEVEKTVGVIEEAYPDIRIAGYRDGYLRDDHDREQAISIIVESNPRYVIVGMGTPKQEEFAILLKEAGYKGSVFTCGGFIHQTAGGLTYYPEWVDKYNLRGFYRQYKEKGIVRRNFDTFIKFPILFSVDILRSKKHHNQF